MKRTRFLLLLGACAALATTLTVFRPAAEEVDEGEPSTVSESDVQMYIKVYTAMQDDHDLTVDEAVKPHHISLDDFRQLERRIQAQPRLVDRVREALLEDAKAHAVFAESAATPTPTVTPGKTERRPRRSK